jgi:hypothetical protein
MLFLQYMARALPLGAAQKRRPRVFARPMLRVGGEGHACACSALTDLET